MYGWFIYFSVCGCLKHFHNYIYSFVCLVPVQRIEDDSICIEDMMRECGIIDTRVHESMKGHPGIPSDILSNLFGDGSIKFNANLPRKKVCGIEFLFHIQSYNLFACLLYTVHDDLFFRQIRGHLRSLKPGDACKLLENLVSAWITRCSRLNLHVCSPAFSCIV